MRKLSIVTVLLAIPALFILCIDLVATPMCPCVDPWNIYSFAAWALVGACAVWSRKGSVQKTREYKILTVIIFVSITVLILESATLYRAIQAKHEFQEAIEIL